MKEEFLLMLPENELPGEVELAEKLRRKVKEDAPFFKNQKIHITLSLGVAQKPQGGDLEECLKSADMRFYAAKAAGRNRVISTD